MVQHCGIYKIKHVASGRYYIGSSHHIEYRWNQHIKDLIAQVHDNPKLQAAWNKYGHGAFEFSIVEECQKIDLLNHEQVYLDEVFNAGLQYNIARDASKPPSQKDVPKSQEHKDKIGEAHKNQPKSEEHKRNISIGTQKYYDDHPEVKEVIRQRRLNTKASEKTKALLREVHPRGTAHHNAVLTEESVLKIRNEYVPRVVSYGILARRYNVDRKTIIRIIQRKTWTHV